MADIVRLAIVYDTSNAAQRLTDLDTRLGNLENSTKRVSSAALSGSGRLRGMALAGTRLASGLAAGNLSALGLASVIGRLAGASVFGALVISVVNVVNALHEYKRISDDVTTTIDQMQTAARDARADVSRLLGEAPAESKAEQAIKRLQAAAAALRKEASRIGGAAGEVLQGQATELEAEIQTIGARVKGGARQAALRDATKATEEYNKALAAQGQVMRLLGIPSLEAMQTSLDTMRKRLDFLALSGQAAGDEAQQLASVIGIVSHKVADLQRTQKLFQAGLFTMADALEEFVVNGTFAFSQFLDNILRLLFRDVSENLIGGLVSGIGGRTPSGATVSVGDPVPAFQSGGMVPGVGPQLAIVHGGEEIIPAGRSGSLATNVTFNVYTHTAQDTARFFEENGGHIAAAMAKAASSSSALRRRLSR